MTEIEYRVADLLNFSSSKKPVEFNQAFDAIMLNKISDAVDQKKVEMAQSMFNPQVEVNVEDDNEEEEVNA